MHLSIAFLLATFAATVFAAPSSVSLDAHVILARDEVPSPLSRRQLANPTSKTSLDGNTSGGTGNRQGRLVDGTDNGQGRLVDGADKGQGRLVDGTDKGQGRLVDGTDRGRGRLVDGTTKGRVPGRVVPSVPYYFPDDIIPQNFGDFDAFKVDLYFSLKTFIDVVNQWATLSFPPAWVAYQFRKYVHDVYKIMVLFTNGCQFCTPNFAPDFQNLAKTMILWIQYALQVVYSKYQMVWVQLADSFRFLKVIVSFLLGLVASFGINLPGWYNNLNLDTNIFNAASIPVAKFRDIPVPQLLSTQQHF